MIVTLEALKQKLDGYYVHLINERLINSEQETEPLVDIDQAETDYILWFSAEYEDLNYAVNPDLNFYINPKAPVTLKYANDNVLVVVNDIHGRVCELSFVKNLHLTQQVVDDLIAA